MKKNKISKVMGFIASLSMLVSMNSVNAEAASSMSGSLCGSKISAWVSTSDNAATAVTQWSYSGGSRYAKATVYYWLGSNYYYSTISMTDGMNTASAYIAKKLGGAQVVGGSGKHKVTYEAYTWAPSSSTKAGDVPTSLSGWTLK